MENNERPTERKYIVLKDSREQDGWDFTFTPLCEKMEVTGLKTGDYTLRGLEDIFVVERKGSTAEVAKNITEARFYKELGRMENFDHPYLVLEFSINDIYSFPLNSGIPKYKHKGLKITANYLLKCLTEIDLNYKTKIIYANDRGQDYTESLFKYMSKKYGKKLISE